MKFEKLKAGDILWDVHSHQSGNVRGLRTVGCWGVHIVSLDAERRCAVVSWNSNRPVVWTEKKLSKLRAVRPNLIRTSMGTYRLPARGEVAP